MSHATGDQQVSLVRKHVSRKRKPNFCSPKMKRRPQNSVCFVVWYMEMARTVLPLVKSMEKRTGKPRKLGYGVKKTITTEYDDSTS